VAEFSGTAGLVNVFCVTQNGMTGETPRENDKTKRPISTLHKTSQLYLTVLHKYINCSVKWNAEKVKIGGIEIVWYLDVSGTVDSSVVRMVSG
jgi:hypothetical protein